MFGGLETNLNVKTLKLRGCNLGKIWAHHLYTSLVNRSKPIQSLILEDIMIDNDNMVPLAMIIKKKRLEGGEFAIKGKCLVDGSVQLINLMSNLIEI